jgi:hypothetical protein
VTLFDSSMVLGLCGRSGREDKASVDGVGCPSRCIHVYRGVLRPVGRRDTLVLGDNRHMTGGTVVITWVGSFYEIHSFHGTCCNWTRRGRPAEQVDDGLKGACNVMRCSRPIRQFGLRYMHEG